MHWKTFLFKAVIAGITLGDASISATDSKITNEKKIPSYHIMKVVKSNYLGEYAIISELRDLSKFKSDDEVEINYLKNSLGKWVVVEKDFSRILENGWWSHTYKCSNWQHIPVNNNGVNLEQYDGQWYLVHMLVFFLIILFQESKKCKSNFPFCFSLWIPQNHKHCILHHKTLYVTSKLW